MGRTLIGALLLAGLFWLVAGPLWAQQPRELLTRGIQAYRSLNYSGAAGLLRRSLAATGSNRLADSLRSEAYVYLGAAELFAGRQESASEAFRQAVAADPSHRPDPLIFPPAVTEAYGEARRETPALRLAVPPDTTILPGRDRFRTRLYSSGVLTVRVELEDADSVPIRSLYAGAITDSLDVAWDGLNGERQPALGSLTLRATSGLGGQAPATARLGISTRLIVPDTAAHPTLPASRLANEIRPKGPALRTLGIGVAAGLTALLLPGLITGDGGGSTSFVVGGAIGIVTALGFFGQRPGSVIPDSVALNQAVRDRWKAQVDSVRALNEKRKAQARLEIRVLKPLVAEQSPP